MARQKRQFMRQGVADLPDRASVLAYIGAPGEPIFDGESLRMHDGSTPGGIRLSALGPLTVNDQDATIGALVTFVSVKPLSATRTITLPDHAIYPVGQDLVIADGSGACSDGIRINIATRSGAPILGIDSAFLASAGGSIRLRLLPTRDAWILA